ncbi:MAG: DUF7305 domain-containing protein [Planctomycetota bacterium]
MKTNHSRLFQAASSRSGNAMVITMGMLVVLAGLASVLADVTIGNLRLQTEHTRDIQLTIASESAANCALSWIQNSWEDDFAPAFEGLDTVGKVVDVPLSDYLDSLPHEPDGVDMNGSLIRLNGLQLTAEVEKLSGDAADASVYLIRATGIAGNPSHPAIYRRHRVEITTYPVLNNDSSETSMFGSPLTALTGYHFGGNAHTDSWNSGDGQYEQANAGEKGDLVSEGIITVADDDNVKGDVHSNQNTNLPTFDYDTYVTAYQPASHADITSSTTLTSGIYEVNEIAPGNNNTISIDGPVVLFVDGPIDLHKTSINYMNDDASLVIFQSDYDGEETTGVDSFAAGNTVLGAFTGLDKKGGTITSAKIQPERFQLYSNHDGAIKFAGNMTFGGVIYAPRAQFKLAGTADVFGSLIAGSFDSDEIVGSFFFHYDEGLTDPSKFPAFNAYELPTMVIGAWRTSQLSFGAP